MGSQQYIIDLPQLRVRLERLGLKDIQRRSTQLPAAQRGSKRVLIDQSPS